MFKIFMWLKSQKIMTLKFKDGLGEVNMRKHMLLWKNTVEVGFWKLRSPIGELLKFYSGKDKG